MSLKIVLLLLSIISLKIPQYQNLLKYVVNGYEFVYRNRDEKRGGGVGIYTRDMIEFKVNSDISKLDDSIEHLWVEI